MIELASDPNAKPMDWRVLAPGETKRSALDARRAPQRGGHPWPFISRHGEQPTAKDALARPEARRSSDS